jgi:molybdopterin converting factor subunit 1
VEAPWTVALAAPIGRTEPATSRPGGRHEACKTIRAEHHPETAATSAAHGIEQVDDGGGGLADHFGECNGRNRPLAGYNGAVEITVLLFASIADKAGVRRVSLPFEAGDTVATVRDRLVDRYPQIRPTLPTLLYALNEEYVKEWEPVSGGSTLALIPPVSGG